MNISFLPHCFTRQYLSNYILVLVTGFLLISCLGNRSYYVDKSKAYPRWDFYELLSNIVDTKEQKLLFKYEKNWHSAVLLLQSLKGDISAYAVETFKQRRENKKHKLFYQAFELTPDEVAHLSRAYQGIDFNNLRTDTLIQGYNHNWTDCTLDELWVFGKENQHFSFHCLRHQDSLISGVEYAMSVVAQLNSVISFQNHYDSFINVLPKGKTYSRGMFNIYLLTEEQAENWRLSAPKRQYQAAISDSITKILSEGLTAVLLAQPNEVVEKIDEHCYSLFDVYFDRTKKRWLIGRKAPEAKMDRDDKKCRRALMQLLLAYQPNYDLLYGETRRIDLLTDSVLVKDSNFYGF